MMKRIALLLVVIIALSMVLSSCGLISSLIKPDTAEAAWNIANLAMSAQKNFQVDTRADISITVMGSKYEQETSGRSIVINSFGKGLYLYDYNEGSVFVDNRLSYSMESSVAYVDGRVYVCNGLDDNYSKLTAQMSKRDFLDFYTSEESDINALSPEGAEHSTFERKDDGEIEVAYTGFSRKRVNEIVEFVGLDIYSVDTVFTDASIKLVLDTKNRIDELTVKLYADSNSPAVTVSMEYSEYKSADRADFDTEGFVEVVDPTVPQKFADALADELELDESKFSITTTETVLKKDGTEVESTEVTNRVSLRNEDGNFFYRIDSYSGEEETYVDYRYGHQRLYVGGLMTEKADQTEAEAKALISSLVNNLNFDTSMVKDLERLADGGYKLECRVADEKSLRQLMATIGAVYQSYEFTVTVQMSDKGLEHIESSLTIYGQNFDYILETTHNFDK